VLWLVVVTKFSDMGAYLVGSLIGRHPMVPHISPKKTWEGFFGALIFSTGGACGLLALMPEKLACFAQKDALILGPVLGFAAIIGDLAESIVKRSAEVKDSGRFLPGIGGALDLIDSILFTPHSCFSTCGSSKTWASHEKRRVVILGATGRSAKAHESRARYPRAHGDRGDVGDSNEAAGGSRESFRAARHLVGRWRRGAAHRTRDAARADMVLIAIVGTGGLRPALAAISGKDPAVASADSRRGRVAVMTGARTRQVLPRGQ
jgi:hypothetical protein